MHAVLRIPLVAFLCALLSACFFEVIVPRGGSVTSVSTNLDCAESTNCAVEVLDTTFSETLTAVPREGFAFLRWQAGNDFVCPGSTNPVCVASNTFLAGDPIAEAVIPAAFRTWYAMPVFEFVGIDTDGDGIKDHLDDDDDNDGVLDVDDGCPLDPTRTWSCDTVFVDGTEWAQVKLFYNLSWNQINAVCPGGVCIDNGMLAGLDMTGWRWATVDEMNDLFNDYIDPLNPTLGPGPDNHLEINGPSAPAFFADGWEGRVLTSPGDLVTLRGMTSSTVSGNPTQGSHARVDDNLAVNGADLIDTIQVGVKTLATATVGAWFYRP